MKTYFHADNSDYSRALKHTLIVTVIPIFAICVFCTVNIVLHYDSTFTKILALIIALSVLFEMIFVFSAVYIIEKKKRRHAKFTYFDILPHCMVYSEYAGEFIRYGERIILRRLYQIPFSAFESVTRDPKKTPRCITINGEIREYFYESDRLGYHIDENDNLVFDTAILNIGMYNTLNSIEIKKRFGNTKELEKVILLHKERFDNIPEKPPFNISDFVPLKRKRRLSTSNAALEAPSFSRKWK